ncbi:hypothetical protein [Sphaerisporangium perillae]|nr:hypothetical protein [Sphaerisporangium perillae]
MPQTPHSESGTRGLLLAPLAACPQADNRDHYYNYSSLTSYMKVAG